MTGRKHHTTVSRTLTLSTLAIAFAAQSASLRADDIKWIPASQGSSRPVSANTPDGRRSFGPIKSRHGEGLPTRDTFGPGSGGAASKPRGRRPDVPVNAGRGRNDSSTVGDAFINAWINRNRGQSSSGGTTTPTVPPPNTSTDPRNGPESRTSTILFQVLNDRIRADRARAARSRSVPATPSASPWSPAPKTSGVRLGVYGDVLGSGGFRVTNVVPGEPGSRLGLEPGDVILQVNRRTVRSVGDILRAINSPFGAQLLIRNVRDGRNYLISFNAFSS